MNGLIEWWSRNTVAANLLMVGIIIGGLIGYFKLEREIDPTVRFNGLQVTVAWPGAGPKEIEEQIVSRIEESFSDLDNIDFIRSFSREGVGQVWMKALDTVDFPQFMNAAKDRIDAINSFPRDMEPPQVQQWVNRDEYLRVALHGNISERRLKRLSETLRREVAALPNISLVELFGVRNEEVSIEVSEESLRRYNLSFSEVAAAIRNSSLNLSSGSVRTEAGDNQLTVRNRADSEADFADIIVRQTGDGGIIRVGDVATVVDGFEDNEILATLNGEPAVLIQVMSGETMQIVDASNAVREWIEKRSETLPAGVTLTLWTDQAEAFKGRMSTIMGSAGQGLVLVLLVLMFTLRPIVAFWVSVGIATAYAGAFVLLPAVDVSLNMISTFAFLLVLGIVVDDAIVVGESIHSESQKTGGGITAAVLGAQLVAKPVIFGVLTTIIAFLPWLFMSGGTSEFTRHITWVVILALAFSLIEALLILPAHLSKLKPRERLGRFGQFQKGIATSIISFAERTYRPAAQWAVDNRWLVTAIFIAAYMVFVNGLLGAGFVKTSFMPEFESEEININVTLPDGTPYSRAEEVLAQMQAAQERWVAEVEEAEGETGTLVENWYTRSRRDSVIAIVKLAPAEVRTLPAKEAALRLRELIGDIPDAEEVTVRYTFNNSDPGLQFSISHPDLDMLQEASEDFMAHLRTYDALYDIRDNISGATDEVQMSLKPGAEKLGLTIAEVARQVRQAYFGEEVQRLPRDGQDVKVMVKYPTEARRNIESLKHFRVRTADGREVPLEAVADLIYAPGISQILHWDRRRATIISADLKDDVRDDIMTDLQDNFFPEWESRFPGVQRGAIGQAEGERRFFQEVVSFYAMAFFAMYMLLAIAFRSYFQPILIMVAIPFATVGAILGHFVTDLTMAIFSWFGVAAAAGVVINDNLVLMDYCNRLRERGVPYLQAIVDAGVARFRPIFLTTLTTFIGLVPMMLEQSTQAAFLKPIVVSLAFGVLTAFFVTLFLVPALYSLGHDFQRGKLRVKGWFKSERPPEVPQQAE